MKPKSILLLILFVIGSSCKDEESKPNKVVRSKFEWKQSANKNIAFQLEMDSLNTKIEKGIYGNIDEIFVSKGDSIYFNKQFNLDYSEISKDKEGKMGCGSNMCKDSSEVNLYNYYHPKYHPYYLDTKLHTIQSITKSVTSTIIGNAIQNNDLKGVDDPIYPFFSNYELSDSMKSHLKSTTLKDVLTMQLGLKWSEMGMSLEMESNVSAMELSDDWIAYTLNQPVQDKPGTVWNYNSGASQLLSQIIKSVTQETVHSYAKKSIFLKLDIKDYYWKTTPTSLSDTEGGLYLRADDLAKIGLLYLQDGVWNGERILPRNWAKAALDKQVKDIYKDGGKEGYGYQWWITSDEAPLAVGLGYGNQILVIIPECNIVGVVYAWNVFEEEAKYIFRDFVDVIVNLKKE